MNAVIRIDSTLIKGSKIAASKRGLVPKKVEVTNYKGTKYMRTIWVKPEDLKKEEEGKQEENIPDVDGLNKFFEEHGGREKIREAILGMRKQEEEGKGSQINLTTGSVENRRTDKLIDLLSKKYNVTQRDILENLGIRDKKAGSDKSGKNKKIKEKKKEPIITITKEDETFNPSSENYRYKDTGYIAGSRKELAAQNIREFKKRGDLVRTKDVDWESIEENPREAKQLIQKSNLFGQVDWDVLKKEGMDPGAGFLIDRIYASIAKEPEDNPEARKDYTYGIESIRDRFEKCKTVDEVIGTISEIKDEYKGVMFKGKESEEYASLREVVVEKRNISQEIETKLREAAAPWHKEVRVLDGLRWQIEKRESRGWKPDPDLQEKYKESEKKVKEYEDKFRKLQEKYPSTPREDLKRYERAPNYRDDEYEYRIARDKLNTFLEASISQNLESNPVTRAWNALGDRFFAVLNYRTGRGSKSFQNHVVSVRTNKIKDWTWAESKGPVRTKKEKKESVRFQLKVAENFERVGGRDISVDSTLSLKEKFNLREVQSGNWVLKDPVSAQFHTIRSAEAFADLADLIGISDSQVSLNGRLAIAFGARGTGNAGFGGAAKAHYESVQRVINITKMGGGGCLGHEWFHAFDNMISESSGFGESKKDTRIVENPWAIKDQELRDSVINLVDAMETGNETIYSDIEYTDRDYKNAQYNFKRTYGGGLASKIKDAGNIEAAFDEISKAFDDTLTKYAGSEKGTQQARIYRKNLKRKKEWQQITAAYYGGQESGGKIKIPEQRNVSSFKARARDLDGGGKRKYWESTREMAARAFSAYVEDSLAEQGKKNDYLSVFSDNKYYKDPFFGDTFPFPEGEERKKINEAMKKLFEVVSKRNIIQKAIDAERKRFFIRLG